MVISVNPEPSLNEFNTLLTNTLNTLSLEAHTSPKRYLGLWGTKLEKTVFEHVNANAKATPFENSIELISGQRFPDIIALKYYGIEVKTTKQNHWKTTGNSVLESTRVEGIERIFLLFGKLFSPVEFRCRPYEECLREVVVTHSPRYLIDMELTEGQTIFNKINLSYDSLRNTPNPIKPIVDYYKSQLKPGEEVWWFDQEEPKGTSLIIRIWNNLSKKERNLFTAKGMVFFPGIFGTESNKFNKLAIWLVNSEGIVCPNVRDSFSAGGRGIITKDSKKYYNISKIILTLFANIELIEQLLNETSSDELSKYWGIKTSEETKTDDWIRIVTAYSIRVKRKTGLDIEKYLIEQLKNPS